MKKPIAIGILASMAPSILKATIGHWSHELCNIYVHVDAKFSLDEFDFVKETHGARLVDHRHNVMWGGFSMVEAEITLMQEAKQDGFDYFLLISDDTVPLLTSEELLERLESAESWKPIGATDQPHIRSRYEQFYCADIGVSNPRVRPLEYQIGDADILLDLHMALKAGKFPLPDLFWNSNWKALPSNDVDFVVQSAMEKGLLFSSFKFSLVSDEHYIPTILGRRPQGAIRADKFIWADFNKEPKPHVLNHLSDFEEPRTQGYWFVRKVHDPIIAETILGQIVVPPGSL